MLRRVHRRYISISRSEIGEGVNGFFDQIQELVYWDAISVAGRMFPDKELLLRLQRFYILTSKAETMDEEESSARFWNARIKDVENLRPYHDFINQLLIGLNEVQQRLDEGADGKVVALSI
jgi:hypothetical protein